MSIALVTSIYGDYDELLDPPEQEGVDEYIAVVDRYHDGCQRWRQVIEPRPHMHPRLAAKVAKCRPDYYTDADVTLWVDGGGRLLHGGAALWAAKHVLRPRGHEGGKPSRAQFVHPQRDDVAAEAEVSAGMAKYATQPVLEQVAHYRKEGLPTPSGLWATGFIVTHLGFRYTRDYWAKFGDRWLGEQMRWSYQDQLSEPWLLNGKKLGALSDNLWGNPHVCFTGHRSEL